MAQLFLRIATASMLVAAVSGDASITTLDKGEQMVMNVGGAQLVLKSNNNSGAVPCSGAEVEIVNGQCVARKDTLTKEIIKAYVDSMMEPMQAKVNTLGDNMNSAFNGIKSRVTDLETDTSATAKTVTDVITPSLDSLTTKTDALNKQTAATSKEFADKTKALNSSMLENHGTIAWLKDQSQYKDELTLVVKGNSGMFYPIVFPIGAAPTQRGMEHKLVIHREYSWQAPKKDSNWANSNSHFGFQYTEIDTLHNMWGGSAGFIQHKRNIYRYSRPYGGAELSSPGGYDLIVFLRGGGTKGAVYKFWADMPLSSTDKNRCVPLYKTTKIFDHSQNQYDRSISPKRMNPYKYCQPSTAGGC